MTQGYVFQKLAISVIGFIITVFMSIVFLSISFAKLIFSTFALFLFLFLVFSWIVSFIPGFELSVFCVCKNVRLYYFKCLYDILICDSWFVYQACK